MIPITIEISTDDLEHLLEATQSNGDCMLLLSTHTTEGRPVYLRAHNPRKPGRPRRRTAAVAAVTAVTGPEAGKDAAS